MMKTINRILCFSILVLSIASCGKNKTTEADVTFEFENYVDDQMLQLGNTSYTNAAGNSYTIDLLKYYISNIVLIDTKGNEFALENHNLIDASKPFDQITYTVPNGDYTKIRFLFGVDADHNTSGDQAGDLDPSYGMLWSWNTGYIFMKHEGKYMDANNDEQNLEFHLGKQEIATQIEMRMGGLIVEGEDMRATLRFNLNNMYNNPVVDFNDGATRHSMPSQTAWMQALKTNLDDAFSYQGSSYDRQQQQSTN